MENVISGVAKFQKEVYPARQEIFQKLANGQNPDVLFITCADSRIDPNLVTQTEPGELFICRNAGNIVPPHGNHADGMAASIEFAVAALGVSHIVVCGHSDCGAMKGAIAPDQLAELPQIRDWLGHCRSASEAVKARRGCLGHEHLEEVARENVVQQLQHLRTHPAVTARLVTQSITLHGWLYNIATGTVLCYNGSSEQFEPMSKHYRSIFNSPTVSCTGN